MQYTRVTDGRTDGQTELAWHIRAIAYLLSRVKIIEISGVTRKITVLSSAVLVHHVQQPLEAYFVASWDS